MTSTVDEIQTDITALSLDTESRYLEIIVDQDIRKGRVQKPVVEPIQEIVVAPKNFGLKDINQARRRLEQAVEAEETAESSLARFEEITTNPTAKEGN